MESDHQITRAPNPVHFWQLSIKFTFRIRMEHNRSKRKRATGKIYYKQQHQNIVIGVLSRSHGENTNG